MIYLLAMILIALIGIGYICYHYLQKIVDAVGRPVIIEAAPITIEQPIEPVRKEASLLVDTELIVLQRIETELLRVGETKI